MDGENNGNPLKMDDLGVPLFGETPIYILPLIHTHTTIYVWNNLSNRIARRTGETTHTIPYKHISGYEKKKKTPPSCRYYLCRPTANSCSCQGK